MVLLENGIPSNIAVPLGIAAAVTGGLSLVVGLVTFAKAVVEFRLQNSLKRFEKYQEMNKVYSADPTLTTLRDALRIGGQVLAEFDAIEKYKFMAFYEDIAMMCQSGLMRMEVASYLFGFDARAASNSAEFIANLGNVRTDSNWLLFWSFCDRLNAYSEKHSTMDSGTVQVRWPVESFRF